MRNSVEAISKTSLLSLMQNFISDKYVPFGYLFILVCSSILFSFTSFIALMLIGIKKKLLLIYCIHASILVFMPSFSLNE